MRDGDTEYFRNIHINKIAYLHNDKKTDLPFLISRRTWILILYY